MTNEEVLVAVTLADGTLSITRFFTKSRGPVLPAGADWIDQKTGVWGREPIHSHVEFEVRRAHPKGFKSWRIITEDQLPPDWKDVERGLYRNAIVDRGDKCEYDMELARGYCLRYLRCFRPIKLAELDGKWMRATGQGNAEEAALVEAERQRWRDAPADPRIQEAKTVEELRNFRVE